MAWEEDWVRWTHTTYGLLQSVSLADRLEGGNLATIQGAVTDATNWSTSSVGFTSAVPRQGAPQPGAINVDAATGAALVATTKSLVASLLLVGTISVTETLLSDLLLQRGVVQAVPANLSDALQQLAARLATTGALKAHEWAIDGAHEARILRNVIVHAVGTWEQRAVNDFMRLFPNKTAPEVGAGVTVNVDDLFAYRRAMRTVLNAAARA